MKKFLLSALFIIAVTALQAQPKVYFTKDISPEALVSLHPLEITADIEIVGKFMRTGELLR